jgi:chromosomal replication initiation ATPase DnaA
MNRKNINPYVYPGIRFADAEEWTREQKKLKQMIIAKKVMASYTISFSELTSGNRTPPLPDARAMCAFIFSNKMGHKDKVIAKFLCLDRSTVAVGRQRMQKKIRKNKLTEEKYMMIEENLKQLIKKENELH